MQLATEKPQGATVGTTVEWLRREDRRGVPPIPILHSMDLDMGFGQCRGKCAVLHRRDQGILPAVDEQKWR